MKGEVPLRVGDRADDGQAGALVEKVVADHQGRTPALVLVPRLGIERQGDQIPFGRGVGGHPGYHASRPAGVPQSSSDGS